MGFFVGCARYVPWRLSGRKSSSFDKLRMRILCEPTLSFALTLSLSKGEGGFHGAIKAWNSFLVGAQNRTIGQVRADEGP